MKEHIKVLLSALLSCYDLGGLLVQNRGGGEPKKINECILELIGHYLSDFWKTE